MVAGVTGWSGVDSISRTYSMRGATTAAPAWRGPGGHGVGPDPVLLRVRRVDPKPARIQPQIAPDDERQRQGEQAWCEPVSGGGDGARGGQRERDGASERTPHDGGCVG